MDVGLFRVCTRPLLTCPCTAGKTDKNKRKGAGLMDYGVPGLCIWMYGCMDVWSYGRMYVDNLARSAGGNGVVPLIFDSLAITPKPLNTEACVRVKRGLVQTQERLTSNVQAETRGRPSCTPTSSTILSMSSVKNKQ